MNYYLGIAIKLVPILIGSIFILKMILMSKDKQRMKELDKKLTPSAKFKMVVFFVPALLLAATIAIAIGDYSDSLIDDSELVDQKQDKEKKSGLQDVEQQLSCSPIGALTPFSKCDK